MDQTISIMKYVARDLLTPAPAIPQTSREFALSRRELVGVRVAVSTCGSATTARVNIEACGRACFS